MAYFTKEITISPRQEGKCVLDLFQHFAPYSTNKHEAWQVTCHATYIQAVRAPPRMEQEDKAETYTMMDHQLQDNREPLVTGMPLIINCSHSYYSYKNAQGETKKEYYPLALIPMEDLDYAVKMKNVNGNMYDFSPRLNWVPFTPNGSDTAQIWLQYPKTRIHQGKQANYMPFPDLMSNVLITVWLIFKKCDAQ